VKRKPSRPHHGRAGASRRRSRVKTLLTFLGVFLWIPVMMGLVFYYLWVAVPYRGYPGATLLLEIPPHRSALEVLQILQDRGVIRPGPFARVYLSLTGRASGLRAGEYLFDHPLTAPEVLDNLIRGEIYYHRVTLPEGLRSAETFSLFQRQGFGTEEAFREAFGDTRPIADLDGEAADLEGYLFPDTYLLAKGTTAAEIVQQMANHVRALWTTEWQERARSSGLSVREVMTLASLIEKETARDEERPLISSVFHNRLRKRMRLQCDPTIIYALAMRSGYRGRITRRDLALDSRYNTYVYGGLPPGPIANPGLDAIRAALYPDDTDYLYFVSMNTGRHTFSTNLRDHSIAVRKYQR